MAQGGHLAALGHLGFYKAFWPFFTQGGQGGQLARPKDTDHEDIVQMFMLLVIFRHWFCRVAETGRTVRASNMYARP
jgi:hypothetical protein